MPGTELAPSPEEGGICITEALITKRNLTFLEDDDLSEKMFHTLAELQTVRLDREGITVIRNLESLQNIHSLYLQSNKIQKIENLACIPSLRFLSLAGNHIKQVENLLNLPHLQFLDLSENLIETLKLDEFPQSLLILNLTGNSCTKQNGYRELVIGALPLLLDLDGQPVPERWASDEEENASGDEDEEFPELSGPFCSEQGFLKDLEQEMTRHKEHRQQAALTEHLLRMETQLALTDLPLLPEEPMARDSNLPVPPEQEKTPTEPASSPQTYSATKMPCPLVSLGQQGTAQAQEGARAAVAPKASLTGVRSTTKTMTKKIKN
ncbi:leucine-rich repeat-containing protein 46 [Trichechus inunguis]|uniref:Leucine-rich repeat-containing protein 46 n=1 Tax=Trichechus manatus latirostris TaxID=127582 RepID=A0A2Y9DNW7_TRIMA|nr:leucine-rich repeat-containing protein 46 [Trichechus manatus latirostris]